MPADGACALNWPEAAGLPKAGAAEAPNAGVVDAAKFILGVLALAEKLNPLDLAGVLAAPPNWKALDDGPAAGAAAAGAGADEPPNANTPDCWIGACVAGDPNVPKPDVCCVLAAPPKPPPNAGAFDVVPNVPL